VSDAVGLFANRDALRAVFSLARFVGAFDLLFKVVLRSQASHILRRKLRSSAPGNWCGREMARRSARIQQDTLDRRTSRHIAGGTLIYLSTCGFVACFILNVRLELIDNITKIIALDYFIEFNINYHQNNIYLHFL